MAERGKIDSMKLFTKMFVNVNEKMHKGIRKSAEGQTMTEYALIMAAIAIVAIVAYTTLGTTIGTLVNNVIACL